jgi:hypothetical protein
MFVSLQDAAVSSSLHPLYAEKKNSESLDTTFSDFNLEVRLCIPLCVFFITAQCLLKFMPKWTCMFPQDSHSLALQYKPEQLTVEFFPWYHSIKT